MLVVFEGIDGSGKTTLSDCVASELSAGGLRVEHVRPGGRLSSEVAERIRELARDPRNLALGAYAELLLYTAREAQQLEEVTVPATARADVVIADRFLYSGEVLARWGRGLPAERVTPVIEAAAQGVVPDLTVLADVDPRIAQARRRADEILRPGSRACSREELSGAGLLRRLRQGYRELSQRDPDRWLVIDNSGTGLEELTLTIVREVRARLGGAARARRPVLTMLPRSPLEHTVIVSRSPERDVRRAFVAWVARRAASEPEVAACLLAGLCGEGIDELRLQLAQLVPALVAYGMRGLADPASWELRRLLAEVRPREIARSLADVDPIDDQAWALRDRLADVCPAEVALSLTGFAGARAWALRERLWRQEPDAVVASLAADASPRAWALRERWLGILGGEVGLTGSALAHVACSSVRGLDSPQAWSMRVAARADAPVAALVSLTGCGSERAWRWRARHIGVAPRPVLRSIVGLRDLRAWELRDAAGPSCREVLESIAGMDDDEAWHLREGAVEIWPAATAQSLGALAHTSRGRALLGALLQRFPDDVGLWRQTLRLERVDAHADADAGAGSGVGVGVATRPDGPQREHPPALAAARAVRLLVD